MAKTILCADDSTTMQKVCEITFKATDYQYEGAKSADEALALARKNKPALILADAVMPGKTGYDLCGEIKSDASLSDVPVVILCGNSQTYDAARGSQVGADGHLTKPWDTQVMLDKIAELLSKFASEGVAKGNGASAAARPAPPTPVKRPTPPPAPSPPSPPSPPSAGAGAGAGAAASAPRSATIMGMPTIKMPPGKDAGVAGVSKVTPPSMGAKPAPPAPPTPPPAKPAPPPKAPPPARAAPPAAARKPAPAPPPRAGTGASASRPPMVAKAGSASRAAVRTKIAQSLPAAAAQIVYEAGLDPESPEIQALVKITHEVIERIVWEVVPELAEAIIRENLDTLAAKRG